MSVGAKLYIKTQTLSKECLEMKFQLEMLISLISSVATICMMHATIMRRKLGIVLHHCYTRTLSTNKRQSMRNDNRIIYMYKLLANFCCLSSSDRACMIRPCNVPESSDF